MVLPVKNFIEEFTDYVVTTQRTHPHFARALGYTMLALAVGSKPTFRTVVGEIKANLYFQYIAPSGIGHKTTPFLNVVKPIIKKMDERFAKVANIVKPDGSLQPYRHLFPPSGSPEGLIDYLTNPENNTEGLSYIEEFSRLFKQMMYRGYANDLLEAYSEMYDGYIVTRMTKNSGYQSVDHVYACNVATSSYYLFQLLKGNPEFWTQGLGNRYLYILGNGMKPNKMTAKDFIGDVSPKKQEEAIERFAEFLIDIKSAMQSYPEFELEPNTAVSNIITDFLNENENLAYTTFEADPNDPKGSYIKRLTVSAIKITMLNSINRTRGSNTKVIEEDVQDAIKIIEEHYDHLKGILTHSATYAQKVIDKDWSHRKDRLLAILEQYGGIMKSSHLYHKLSIARDKYEEAINTLLNVNKIKMFERVRTGSRGAPCPVIALPDAEGISRIVWNPKTKEYDLKDGLEI